MEVKAIHIITNFQPREIINSFSHNNVRIQCYAGCNGEDRGCEAEQHWHFFVTWPIGRSRAGGKVLVPRKPNWIRSIRRKHECTFCATSQSGARCTGCKNFIKCKWPQNDKHVENIKAYILRKTGALYRTPGGLFRRHEQPEREVPTEVQPGTST